MPLNGAPLVTGSIHPIISPARREPATAAGAQSKTWGNKGNMTVHVNSRDFAASDTTRSAPAVTRIYRSLGKFDRRRGQRYNAHLGSPEGELLVTDALDVEFAACRALKARGVTGRLEAWRPGAAYPDLLIADIGETAGRTIREDERRGPTIVQHKPWSQTGLHRRSASLRLPAV
jgi:hypothetical protein